MKHEHEWRAHVEEAWGVCTPADECSNGYFWAFGKVMICVKGDAFLFVPSDKDLSSVECDFMGILTDLNELKKSA